MNQDELDLYVIARPGKAAWLTPTIESAKKFLNPNPRQIIVVSPTGEAGLADGRGALGFAAENIPVLNSWTQDQRRGIFSEFLRWGLAKVGQSRAFLVMDSGSLLNAPCAVLDDKRYLHHREELFDFPSYRMHNWLFGKYPPPGGWFIPQTMAFDRAVVLEMLALIEKRYGNVRWYDAILNILNRIPTTRFSATQAYGGYVQSFHGEIARQERFEHLRLRAGSDALTAAPAVTIDSDDPLPPARSNPPILRMSTLGINGRFGNQIFQYAYLRWYAERHEMQPQCPEWIGSALFGHKDQFSIDPLPLRCELEGEDRSTSHELLGYFQHHTSVYRQWQAQFKSLFAPLETIRAPLEQAVEKLRGGGTLIALHLRRGDYLGGTFWPAPTEWYVEWLKTIWPTLDRPVLYVASDEPEKVAGDFAFFLPKMAGDLNVKINGAEFYPDFFVLSRCNVLAISNSTFSFAAAMLNERAARFLRPDPDRQSLMEFDPWNSSPLLAPARKLAA